MTSSSRYNESESLSYITFKDVVATRAAGAVDRLSGNFADNGDQKPASVMPSGAQINGPAAVKYLRTKNPSSDDYSANLADVDLGAVPTADYISHTSMKDHSKLVIRIVPMATSAGGQGTQSTLEAMRKDAELYFPQVSLQAVNELSEERFQLFEGFDAHKLLLFGSKPKIWNYQLMVLNGARPKGGTGASPELYASENMDFADELYRRYEKHYRGTKCIERRSRCFLTYEDRIVEGYLVMIALPRNATMPNAIPMSLTIVVINETFTVSGMTEGGDQTLSDLLAREREVINQIESMSPTELANAKLTPEQRKAAYAANQAATAEIQSTAQEIREQAQRAQALQREAKTKLADITALQLNADRALLESTTPAQAAAARTAQAELQRQKDEYTSLVQTIGKTAALAEGELTLMGDAQQQSALEQMTAELNAAEHRQRQLAMNLEHSVEGDLTRAREEDRLYADVLTTNEDGTRTLVTYDVTGDDATAPDDTDATVVGDVVAVRDVTNNPEYDGVDDSTTTRELRFFSP